MTPTRPRVRRLRPSLPAAGRGKKCGCVAPTSYETMRLRQRVAYL